MSISTSLKIASTGGIIAAAGIMFGLSTQSLAAVPGKYCQAVTRDGAIKCCEQNVKNSSNRVIMGGGRCVSVVVCRRGSYAGASANYLCWVPQTSIAYLKPKRRLKPIDSRDPHASPEPRNQNGNQTGGQY